jgi:hypothetical protein
MPTRTTVTFDDDVAAAIEHLRAERAMGVSEAVNQLVRAGLKAANTKKPTRRFRQESRPLGMLVDVTNVWKAIEEAEGPAHR